MLRPRRAWAVIAAQPTSIRHLFTGYVMILGALNPVCWTIGRLVFGERALGGVAAYRPNILAALIEGLISYLLVLISVCALTLLMEALAPPFGAVRDRHAAFKVAAYSGTAGWLASVFYLVPVLAPLAVIGVIYGLYLLYLGAEIVIRPQRTLGYVALVVVCFMVLMMLTTSLTKLISAFL
jgi:hypothetical protein